MANMVKMAMCSQYRYWLKTQFFFCMHQCLSVKTRIYNKTLTRIYIGKNIGIGRKYPVLDLHNTVVS